MNKAMRSLGCRVGEKCCWREREEPDMALK
jgi:hypothetical protein